MGALLSSLLLSVLLVGSDLASELEAEMRGDRLEEHLKGPLLGCVASEDEVATLPGGATRYRALARGDFRAAEGAIPDDAVSDPHEQGAVHLDVVLSCATGVEVERVGSGGFEARIASLRFFALAFLDRCWWNPRLDLDEERTLRHQQGHFALFEVAARRLDADRDETRARLVGRGRDAQRAVDDLEGQWGRQIQQAVRDLARRAERYDRETANGRDAEAQSAWSARLARELAGPSPDP